MKTVRQFALLGPIALLTLSAACTQMLGIQDAWVDPTLTAGSHSDHSSAGASSGTAGQSSGGTSGAGSVAGSSHNHSGGSVNKAGANSGGASAGSDGEMAGAAGADIGQPPTLCENYCDAVLKNCTGKYEQYRTRGQCLEVCKLLPPGTPSDGNTNSVECRLRQARFAEAEAFLYCKTSGPLGAGKCGSNCESYCSLMGSTCTASSTAGNVELSYFENTQACMSDCNAIPDDPTGPTQYSSSATVEPSSLVGNNVYCRTYHATAGIEQDAASEHCPHAMGGDPCIAQ